MDIAMSVLSSMRLPKVRLPGTKMPRPTLKMELRERTTPRDADFRRRRGDGEAKATDGKAFDADVGGVIDHYAHEGDVAVFDGDVFGGR